MPISKLSKFRAELIAESDPAGPRATREQLEVRSFSVGQLLDELEELLRLLRVLFTLRKEHGALRVILDDLAGCFATSSDEANLMAVTRVATHSEGELVFGDRLVDDDTVLRLDPDDLALQLEAPHVHDGERFVLHRCHAPEEEERVVRDRRQIEHADLLPVHDVVVLLGSAALAGELVAELPRWICDDNPKGRQPMISVTTLVMVVFAAGLEPGTSGATSSPQ